METTGKRIKQLRLAKEMTQEELAKICGYKSGRAMISQIESDIITVPAPKLQLIADALGTTVVYLLGNSSTKKDSQSEYILALINSLSPQGQRNVQEYIEMLIKSGTYTKGK